MKQISEFLSRFKNLGLGEQLSKEALVEEINAILGLNTISLENISIKNQNAFIKGGSVLKNEIFFHKEKILNQAKKRIGPKFVIKDIR